MAADRVRSILERVMTWPRERQEDAADVLAQMEEQESSPYRLSDEQADEVRRRLDDPRPKFITLAEARARIRHAGS